ncbi:MAG: MGMT family protein [Patescibacteria group bacterium]
MGKTWTEKLHDSKDLPKTGKLNKNARIHWHGDTMTVPAPLEVDEIMKKVPKGKIITINEIRQKIAKKHGSDIACPLTCGIFSWIAAHAAEEQREEGKKNITPWWRTLKSDGSLNPKFPGECDLQKKILEDEGFTIKKRGKKYFVEDFEKYLA